MKINCKWDEGLRFIAESEGHMIPMDAHKPFGRETAPSPKDLLLAAICGCTAMDVASLMKKMRQPMTRLEISAEADVKEEHPAVFKVVRLTYFVEGNIDSAKLTEAISLSQSRYCAVSAMVSKAVPIQYRVILNGTELRTGVAHFAA